MRPERTLEPFHKEQLASPDLRQRRTFSVARLAPARERRARACFSARQSRSNVQNRVWAHSTG
jgi:hypothetical protein